MSINKFARLFFSMAIATMLVGFSASANQEKPKTEVKKEMKSDKPAVKKEHKHKGMKAKAEKEKKMEKKEDAQPK